MLNIPDGHEDYIFCPARGAYNGRSYIQQLLAFQNSQGVNLCSNVRNGSLHLLIKNLKLLYLSLILHRTLIGFKNRII